MIFAKILTAAVLGRISARDFAFRQISDFSHLEIFFLSIFIDVPVAERLICGLISLILMVSMNIGNKKIGAGDVKLCVTLSLSLGNAGFAGIVCGILAAAVFSVISRQKKLPLAPFIAAGAVTALSII